MALPVYAEEGEAPAKPDAAKSAEGGGEEGGGKKSKGPKDVSGGRFAGDPVFIHMDPLILPVISDKGVEQIVTIQMSLEINRP